jgi:hypothetical protein
MSSPDFYPEQMDFESGFVSFVKMSRKSYRSSTFLDHRSEMDGRAIYEARLSDLNPQPNTAHYIFHAAFCCSTLLARCLEAEPSTFVLKEPQWLTQMAMAHVRSTIDARRLGDILPRCVNMLSRPYVDGRTPIIKVNDLCNGIAELLLERNPQSLAIFVTIPLDVFLMHVLKTPYRRAWAWERLRKQRSLVDEHFPDIIPTSDAEATVLVWSLYVRICGRLQQRHGSRVVTLDGEHIASHPWESACMVANHLGAIDPKKAAVMRIARSSAKESQFNYSFAALQKDLQALRVKFSEELKAGLSWSAAITPSALSMAASAPSGQSRNDR